MKEIEQLVEISRFYGSDSRYVIAGGGNTSYKTGEKLWVKASGCALATITEDGFAVLDRTLLNEISAKQYSADAAEREEEVKNDLAAACLTPDRRPSVETSLHNAMEAPFVVHLHPTLVGAVVCSQNAEANIQKLFGDRALYVSYTDPGYVLFKEVERRIAAYKAANGHEPEIIMLQNHGIFVGGQTPDEIRKTYDYVLSTIESQIAEPLSAEETEVCDCAPQVVPALRMMLSDEGLKTLRVTNSPLIERFSASAEAFAPVGRPFTPDHIVYCKSNYLYLDFTDTEQMAAKVGAFTARHGYAPKVIIIKGLGLVAAGDNAAGAETITEVFSDMLKIAWLSASFGGPHPMTQGQVDFIDNWEVENYRRKVSAGSGAGRAGNRTVIVTGAAQGFGEGIAACLMAEGANIVVADLNEETGVATAARLNETAKSNRAVFVRTDVSDTKSLAALVHAAVCAFGAIDMFVSNAGVLRAGAIADMTPETFDFVTKINYSAYFYCVKAVEPVMKLETRYGGADYYCDIVQVNSKSGLRGSKANFAYAGGKFGGIGLTQSFALELAPYRIKVNSVCPGNFYEGPLWSDPENGLFVQYLRAGKVPGAKTIEDVREFYMAQVPMRKGTNPADVTRAILYAMEQTCETGQAIPVTGGQVMMN